MTTIQQDTACEVIVFCIIVHDLIVLHGIVHEGSLIMLLSAIVYDGGIVLQGIVRINRYSATFTREPLIRYMDSFFCS